MSRKISIQKELKAAADTHGNRNITNLVLRSSPAPHSNAAAHAM